MGKEKFINKRTSSHGFDLCQGQIVFSIWILGTWKKVFIILRKVEI